jgi:hypothetical protein
MIDLDEGTLQPVPPPWPWRKADHQASRITSAFGQERTYRRISKKVRKNAMVDIQL